MENSGQLDPNNKNDQPLQVQATQTPPVNNIVVYSADLPKHRPDFNSAKLFLNKLVPLLSTAKGLAVIAVCSLLVIGGASAEVINLSSNKHKSPVVATHTKQPSLALNIPASSSTTSTSKPATTSAPSSSTPAATTPATTASSPAKTSSSKTTTSTTSTDSSTSGTTSFTSSSGSSSGNSSGSGGGSGTTTPPPDGCTYGGEPAPCIGSATTGASGWGAPAFDDEFNEPLYSGSGSTSGYDTNWFNENGYNKNGITVSTSNETVSGGNLILTLASSSSGAEISTNAYGLPVGGFAEARIDFPGSGTTVYNWPAWWTSGANWPEGGEADIFEGLGSATTNYHYYNNGDQQSGPFDISGSWTNSFHTYGLYRGQGYNDIYWDGTLVKTYTTSDTGQVETLILTNGCYSDCTPGAQMEVDYVRAWN